MSKEFEVKSNDFHVTFYYQCKVFLYKSQKPAAAPMGFMLDPGLLNNIQECLVDGIWRQMAAPIQQGEPDG